MLAPDPFLKKFGIQVSVFIFSVGFRSGFVWTAQVSGSTKPFKVSNVIEISIGQRYKEVKIYITILILL